MILLSGGFSTKRILKKEKYPQRRSEANIYTIPGTEGVKSLLPRGLSPTLKGLVVKEREHN